MNKEQVLKALTEKEWSDDFLKEMCWKVANYVVYQQDPDEHWVKYYHKFFMDEEVAREDFMARSFVLSGRWCWCKLVKIDHEGGNNEVIDNRQVSM